MKVKNVKTGSLVVCKRICWDHFSDDLGLVLGKFPEYELWEIYLIGTKEYVLERPENLRDPEMFYPEQDDN